MSSFKNFSSMLNDLQRQADGRGTLDGSASEDFLSIAGYEDPAGGGGGDFTIAEVSLIVEEGATVDIFCAMVDEDRTISESEYTEAGTYTINAVLYKGAALVVMITMDDIEVDDGVKYDDDTGEYSIDGDGTITVKPAGN